MSPRRHFSRWAEWRRLAALACVAGVAHAEGRRYDAAADVQYYAPIHDDRPIRSVFVDALVGTELVRWLHLEGFVGLTATFAWGAIVQDVDDRRVRSETTAGGAGPMGLLRVQPLVVGPVSLGLDAVGSVILYDEHFPPGGDVYNFSWRAGPSLGVHLGAVTAEAGFRWMHVSNGQGLGPQNPSYEGRGVSLGVEFAL